MRIEFCVLVAVSFCVCSANSLASFLCLPHSVVWSDIAGAFFVLKQAFEFSLPDCDKKISKESLCLCICIE